MDFERLIATLKNYIIVASVIVIAIRKSINCAALNTIQQNSASRIFILFWYLENFTGKMTKNPDQEKD